MISSPVKRRAFYFTGEEDRSYYLRHSFHTWSRASKPKAKGLNYPSTVSSLKTTIKSNNIIPDTRLVIKDSKKSDFKNGKFIRNHENGAISDLGFFVDNKKNSSLEGMVSEQTIRGSRKPEEWQSSQEWIWYRENGALATKEKYKNGKLIPIECYDEEGRFSGSFCSILKPPVLLVIYENFENYMLDNIILPKELVVLQLKGTITISCPIYKEGKFLKLQSDDCQCDSLKKAIEKFFSSIQQWSPAILHTAL